MRAGPELALPSVDVAMPACVEVREPVLAVETQGSPGQGQDAARAYIRELQLENERLRELVAATERERQRIALELGQVLAELEQVVKGARP
jgi:hypothetical protein